MMNIGVSPFGKILTGKSKPLPNGKSGQRMWVGKTTDITDTAIKAVFEHMWIKAEETGYYEISIEGYGVMKFERSTNPQPPEGRKENG